MTHPGELALRRYLAEELVEPVLSHLRECEGCRAKLDRFREEQRAFATEVPFERFAGGVEKAARTLQQPQERPSRRPWFAAAAGLLLVSAIGWIVRGPEDEASSRIKGGATVEFVVAGSSGQRVPSALESLAEGDRIRIGATGGRYLVALSVDDAGEVSSLYAEPLSGEGQRWMPDSFTLTGAGRETVVVIVAAEPLEVTDLRTQLRDRFVAAHGDLTHLEALDAPGVQVHRTFIKP